jgi:hypothetical protein
VKAAGMKITTDHSPLKLASVTGTNLPWWYAVVLNAGIWELIKDMVIPIDRVKKSEFFTNNNVSLS